MHTHLLTGPGGAGVSSVAAALATALAADAGRGTVTLATLGDDGSMARLLGDSPSLRLVDLAAPPPWGPVDAALADALDRLGADGDAAEEWRRLPGAGALTGLVSLGEAVAATDVLVVDLGDLRRAAELLAAASRAVWLLRGLLGLQALGNRYVGGALARAGLRWTDALEAAGEVVRSPGTRLHVVGGRDPVTAAKVRRGAPPLLLSGVAPGALVRPPAARGVAESTDHPAGTADDWAPFAAVDLAGWPVDADGRLRRSASDAVTPLTDVAKRPSGPVPAAGRRTGELIRTGDHLTWRVPLPWVRAADVQVAYRREDLIVTVHGTPYLVVPPAVARRCTPVCARLDGACLEVEFVLREGAWRRRG